jgi:uncharacterized membrane protein
MALSPSSSGWIERLPLYVVPLLLIGIPLVVGVAAMVAPEAVYDQVVWKHFWGPIHADANGHMKECLLPDGTILPSACRGEGVETESGYNLFNTAAWALLLGICILGAGQMLQRFHTPMDGRLIVAATLWVVAGSVFHVLEDGKLFAAPLRYFFITPIIYLIFAALGILSFLLGQYLRNVAERASVALALQKLWMILAVPIIGYLFLYLEGWDQVNHYLNPVLVTAFALVAFAVAAWRFQRIGRVDPSELVGILSIGWILLGIAYALQFAAEPWDSYAFTPHPLVVAFWAPVIAFGVALAVRHGPRKAIVVAGLLLGAIYAPLAAYFLWDYLAGRFVPALRFDPSLAMGVGLEVMAAAVLFAMGLRWMNREWATLSPRVHAARLVPINALIVFAQMTDAFATAIGIDIGLYREKHVLSAKVIDATCEASGGTVVSERCVPGDAWFQFGAHYPTFLGFVPVKLLVSLLVIYAIDVSNPDESRRHPTLIGLVKFAIIMVGIGPGIRDFVRMGMGI